MVSAPGLDHQHYRNFWPISNLTFLSKVIEKVVAFDYIDSNGLCTIVLKQLSSGSTMTLLIVFIDSRKSVVLVLLHLLAAFAIVDHFSCSQGYKPVLASVTMH